MYGSRRIVLRRTVKKKLKKIINYQTKSALQACESEMLMACRAVKYMVHLHAADVTTKWQAKAGRLH